MKKVTMYQTSDGKLHNSFDEAARYADDRYGNAVCSLAQKSVAIDKYKSMIEFIEDNIDTYCFLKKLKADAILSEDEDEYED